MSEPFVLSKHTPPFDRLNTQWAQWRTEVKTSQGRINKKIKTASYKDSLRSLQVELVKLQKHIIKKNERVLVIIKGRDASGKDGIIKRIT